VNVLKVKVGIAGASMGSYYANIFSAYSDSEVLAICDLSKARAESAAKRTGAKKAITNYDDLLKMDLDIIGVVTPGPVHVKQSIAALEDGKHVFCAVPTAWTLDECYEIIKAVKHTGMKYMLAEEACYDPDVTYVKEMYNAGDMGEIFYCQTASFHDLGGPGKKWDLYNPNVQPDGAKKTYTWRYGWAPFKYIEHNISPIMWVLDQNMIEVTAYGWGYEPEGFEDKYGVKWSAPYNNPNTFETGIFKMKNGCLAKICICWVVAADWSERQYFGTKLSYIAQSEKDLIMKKNESPKYIEKPNYLNRLHSSIRDVGSARSAFLIQEFVKSIINDTQPPIDIYRAVSYTAPGICAHQSVIEKKPIKIPDFSTC
jgi:predicted dehydrogenase